MTTSSLRYLLPAVVVTLGACENAGVALETGIERRNAVTVGVFLDRDGSRTATSLDTVFANVRVALLVKGVF